jgi:hypothetical protein
VLVAVVQVARAQRAYTWCISEMLAGSYRLAPSASSPASDSSCSAFSWPASVRKTWWLFSSTVKSPGSMTPFAGARVGLADLLLQPGTTALMRTYSSVWSSAWPLMISGVRASSIRIESTSSTMA